MERPSPVRTWDLFPRLHGKLRDLLADLEPEDWRRRISGSDRTVKDVVAHLLDGDVRRLAVQRDGHEMPDPGTPIRGYEDLVAHLDRMNAEWTAAARRMSPRILREFLRVTGPEVSALLASLDPMDDAPFGVAWAGQETSPNWFDVAREFTERWHHQQQIREAVGAPPITGDPWMRPLLDTWIRGLPHAFREREADRGTRVTVEIAGDEGGRWTLQAQGGGAWKLYVGAESGAATRITMPVDVAWRSFSGRIPPEDARRASRVVGDARRAEPVFAFVGFMV